MAGNPPKRKVSRSNTRSRRAQWKAEAPALVKTVENGKVVYSRPHQAKVVTDSQGTELFLEYKGRKVAAVCSDERDRGPPGGAPAHREARRRH